MLSPTAELVYRQLDKFIGQNHNITEMLRAALEICRVRQAPDDTKRQLEGALAATLTERNNITQLKTDLVSEHLTDSEIDQLLIRLVTNATSTELDLKRMLQEMT